MSLGGVGGVEWGAGGVEGWKGGAKEMKLPIQWLKYRTTVANRGHKMRITDFRRGAKSSVKSLESARANAPKFALTTVSTEM